MDGAAGKKKDKVQRGGGERKRGASGLHGAHNTRRMERARGEREREGEVVAGKREDNNAN